MLWRWIKYYFRVCPITWKDASLYVRNNTNGEGHDHWMGNKEIKKVHDKSVIPQEERYEMKKIKEMVRSLVDCNSMLWSKHIWWTADANHDSNSEGKGNINLKCCSSSLWSEASPSQDKNNRGQAYKNPGRKWNLILYYFIQHSLI